MRAVNLLSELSAVYEKRNVVAEQTTNRAGSGGLSVCV